jgi:hypothetical protein
MTKSPPVLPAVKLDRVIRLARADSIGVLACSGASLLLSVLGGNWVFAGFAALALVAGAMEWHGQDRLQAADGGGLHWLIGAQGCLYTVIVGYVLWRWRFFDGAAYWAEIPDAAREQLLGQMREAGLDPEKDRDLLLQTMNFVICAVLFGVSTVYQGGLAIWYRLQQGPVAAALGGGGEG